MSIEHPYVEDPRAVGDPDVVPVVALPRGAAGLVAVPAVAEPPPAVMTDACEAFMTDACDALKRVAAAAQGVGSGGDPALRRALVEVLTGVLEVGVCLGRLRREPQLQDRERADRPPREAAAEPQVRERAVREPAGARVWRVVADLVAAGCPSPVEVSAVSGTWWVGLEVATRADLQAWATALGAVPTAEDASVEASASPVRLHMAAGTVTGPGGPVRVTATWQEPLPRRPSRWRRLLARLVGGAR